MHWRWLLSMLSSLGGSICLVALHISEETGTWKTHNTKDQALPQDLEWLWGESPPCRTPTLGFILCTVSRVPFACSHPLLFSSEKPSPWKSFVTDYFQLYFLASVDCTKLVAGVILRGEPQRTSGCSIQISLNGSVMLESPAHHRSSGFMSICRISGRAHDEGCVLVHTGFPACEMHRGGCTQQGCGANCLLLSIRVTETRTNSWLEIHHQFAVWKPENVFARF